MPGEIVTRTISSEADQRLRLTGGAYVRKLKWGTDWTTLRILVRFGINRVSNWTSPPKFYFGLCSGQTAPPGTTTPAHFVGIRNVTGNWTYSAGTVDIMQIGDKAIELTKIENGSVSTLSTATQSSTMRNIACATEGRSCWELQITKGSPWTITGKILGGISATNTTISAVSDAMNDATAPDDNILVSSTVNTFTVDETTYGDLDTLVFSWAGSGANNEMEICDLVPSKIS